MGSARTATRQSGGSSTMHVIVPAAFLLLVGFQAGRMACSFGELEAAAGGDSPGAQRAILSRINRLERLAELAAQARPGSGGALALVGGKPEDPATRDARKLRSLASGWVSGAACKDKDAGCAGWAAKGECASNKAYMDETCPLSCNRCAAGAKAATNVAGPASAAADGAAAAGPTGKDGCPLNRRPFHVIQTADSSTYQQWQSRMMYYHFLKQKAASPCTEMGGFTRLLNTFDGKCDDLCDEIPTFTVKRMVSGPDKPGCDCDWQKVLQSPRCLCDAADPACDCPLDTLQCNFAQCGDRGFVVLNRPYGVLQFLQSAEFQKRIVEDYVIIAETDHLYQRALPNRATEARPVGYKFGYMNALDPKLCKAAQPYWQDCHAVDPVGPSPIIIHTPQLRKLTPHWFALSMALKRDPVADAAYGWVLEMWGYTLAAARMGIKHALWDNIQVEPSALWHCDEAFTRADFYTFHFTYGLEYSLKGHPSAKVGEWSLNKRNYMNAFPPKDLAPPPKCAGACAHRLHELFVDAATHLPNWPSGGQGTLGWVKALAPADFDPEAAAARALLGTGPWQWRGREYWFLQGGLFVADAPRAGRDARKPAVAGTWKAKAGGGGRATVRVELEGCRERCTLTLVLAAGADGGPPDAFDADCAPVSGGAVVESSATLVEPAAAAARAKWSAARAEAPPALRAKVEGSGPWAWDGAQALFFLTGGKLVTPWGDGEWGYLTAAAGGGEVFANFVGESHALTFDDCLAFAVVRKRDGMKSHGALHQAESDAATCSLSG